MYNGKELNEELNLNWYAYGARMYDAAIGRFPSVDPIADNFANLSPFNYASNNPVGNIDLHGLQGVDANLVMAWLVGKYYQTQNNVRRGQLDLLQGSTKTNPNINALDKTLFSQKSKDFLHDRQADSGSGKIVEPVLESVKLGMELTPFMGIPWAVLEGSQQLSNGSYLAAGFTFVFLPMDFAPGGGASKKAGKLISTEPGMQAISKVDDMAGALGKATSQEDFNRIFIGSDQGGGPAKILENPIDGNNYIIDGHHRLQAAQKANTGYSVPIQKVGLDGTGFDSYQEIIDAARQNDF